MFHLPQKFNAKAQRCKGAKYALEFKLQLASTGQAKA
jgi:hypothetical protein